MAKSKPISGVDCEAGAADAIRRVVTLRFGEMLAFRKKALDSVNPEGVHDMRVASRRLRSALRDFLPYARKSRIAKPLKSIKEIADALGQVRDQDVAIIALEKLAMKAPPEVSSGISQLVEFHRAKRIGALEELIPILDGARLAQLKSDFLPALASAMEPVGRRRKSAPSARPEPGPTYREIARATILDRLTELEKLSDSLYHPLKVKPLHKMRIAAKRLRYALELFEKCWGKRLVPFSTRLTALQSSLGDLHDCDIWIVEFGDDLSGKHSRPNQTAESEGRRASSWLLDRFVKLRTKHLRSALAVWREWETNGHGQQLRKIVQSAAKTRASSSRTSTKSTRRPRKSGVTS